MEHDKTGIQNALTRSEFFDLVGQTQTMLKKDFKPAPKYPIDISPSIIQYDEHVFVWLDETGNAGGVATTQKQAEHDLTMYAHHL